jgi:hypothetical protein
MLKVAEIYPLSYLRNRQGDRIQLLEKLILKVFSWSG